VWSTAYGWNRLPATFVTREQRLSKFNAFKNAYDRFYEEDMDTIVDELPVHQPITKVASNLLSVTNSYNFIVIALIILFK